MDSNLERLKTRFSFLLHNKVLVISLILTIGTTLSLLLFSVVRGWEKTRLDAEFERRSMNRFAAFDEQLKETRKILDLAATVISEQTSQESRRSIGKHLGHSIPSLRMLHWIPADATEIAPDTPLLDEQYELLPPLSHQLMIHRLNIDLWNELAQTVQSMNPVESIPFLLESEGESKTYFSILIPVGPEGAETPSVLLATLSLDALSDYAMRKLQAGGVPIRIAEVGKGGTDQTLHWHSSRAEPRPLKSFESSRSLLLARGYQFQTNVTSVARNWRFECYPAKILIDQYRTHQGWGALGMGALATCLFAGYVFTILRRHEQVAEMVDKQTESLRQTNLNLEQEIKRRRETEISLNDAKQAAEAASHAKSRFLANTSHEIRTPLNGIIGITSLLKDTQLDDEQGGFVETIRASGDLLLGLISNILDLSKIESQALELESAPFDLKRTIDQCIEIASPEAIRKGINIVSYIPEKIPTTYTGDSTRFRQILLNHLNNAVKFTSEGGVMLIVSTDQTDEGKEALFFSIRDTGICIPNEAMQRIFKAFSQVDSSTRRKYGGTGLGLAICQSLTKLMGGGINVHSEQGQGSNFTF